MTQRTTILLVEDDAEHADLACRAIVRSGTAQRSDIHHVLSIADAVESVQTTDFDVILLDLHVTDASGLECLQRIRAASKDCAVVALTSSADEQLRDRIVREGAQDFIAKETMVNTSIGRIIRYAIDRQRSMNRVRDLTTELHRRNAALSAARHVADAANDAKTRFLAHMTHEIRTPLTAILGFSELMMEQESVRADPAANEAIKAISGNGRHLLALINDVLDLAKIESGHMNTVQRPVDLGALIEDSVVGLLPSAREKRIELEVIQAGATTKNPVIVETDELRMRQVLINLIGNAIKFTDIGGVRVEWSVAEVSGSPGTVAASIVVRDTGIGMNAEDLRRVFEAYRQAGDTSGNEDSGRGGSGLGLSIAQHLATCLGGHLTATSEVGCGSSFHLVLPRVRRLSPDRVQLDTLYQRAEPKDTLSGRRVLLVEDGPDVQRLVTAILSQEGASVEVIGDGQALVDAMAATKDVEALPDVILMDMELPGMHGLDATRAVRAQGILVPIVALTASGVIDCDENCRAAGCDALLRKPFLRDELIEAVVRQTAFTSDQPLTDLQPD